MKHLTMDKENKHSVDSLPKSFRMISGDFTSFGKIAENAKSIGTTPSPCFYWEFTSPRSVEAGGPSDLKNGTCAKIQVVSLACTGADELSKVAPCHDVATLMNIAILVNSYDGHRLMKILKVGHSTAFVRVTKLVIPLRLLGVLTLFGNGRIAKIGQLQELLLHATIELWLGATLLATIQTEDLATILVKRCICKILLRCSRWLGVTNWYATHEWAA